MMERPIIFSTPMVRAILDGRKTHTRRYVKLQFLDGYNPEWTGYKPVFEYGKFFLAGSNGEPATKQVKPPFQPGDRLWVRETWGKDDNGEYVYRANCGLTEDDSFPPSMFRWKPSIHMPKAAARIWLKVNAVWVDKVQNISEDEARAEGCLPLLDRYGVVMIAARGVYHARWDQGYARRGYGWGANPWVWVIEFEVLNHETSPSTRH